MNTRHLKLVTSSTRLAVLTDRQARVEYWLKRIEEAESKTQRPALRLIHGGRAA